MPGRTSIEKEIDQALRSISSGILTHRVGRQDGKAFELWLMAEFAAALKKTATTYLFIAQIPRKLLPAARLNLSLGADLAKFTIRRLRTLKPAIFRSTPQKGSLSFIMIWNISA